MNGRTNAYLDLAALPPVGAVMLDPRPAFVFRGDGSAMLWANAAGVAFFGDSDLSALLERRFTKASPLAAYVARLAKSLPADHDRLELLRVSFGVTQVALPAACRKLDLGGGARAVLAVGVGNPARKSLSTLAERLADAIAGPDSLAAVIDRDGRVLGASGGFDALEPASAALDALILRAERGDDAVVRETVTVGELRRDAGVARVTIGGERLFLLIVGAEHAGPAAAAGVSAMPTSEPTPTLEDPPVESTGPAVALESVVPPTPAMQPTTPSPGQRANVDEPNPERGESAPVRFLWRTDAAGAFTFVSPELGEVVGAANAPAAGEHWRTLAARLVLDDDGRVAGVLETLASFSGVNVDWPLAGVGEAVAIDLSGMPEFARDRTFRGYRGFGTIRIADRRPVALLAPVSTPNPEPTSAPETKGPPSPDPTATTGDDLDDVARERVEGSAAARSGVGSDDASMPVETPVPAGTCPFECRSHPGAADPHPSRRLSGSEEDAFRRIAEALGVRVAEGAPARGDAPGRTRLIARRERSRHRHPRQAAGRHPDLSRQPTLYANRALLDLLGYDISTTSPRRRRGAIFPDDTTMRAAPPRSGARNSMPRGARRTQHHGRGAAPRRGLGCQAGAHALARSRRRRRTGAVPAAAAAPPVAGADRTRAELETILDTATDGVVVIERRWPHRQPQPQRRGAVRHRGRATCSAAPFTELLAEESRTARRSTISTGLPRTAWRASSMTAAR